jgi:alcohol dehydrogenase
LPGASRIVAVDTRAEKLELAMELGATDVVHAREGVNAVAAVKDVTGGGPDYAFEAIGSEKAIQEAWKATRAGGTVVVVGIMPRGSSLTIDPWQFMSEKTLKAPSSARRESRRRAAPRRSLPLRRARARPAREPQAPAGRAPDAFDRLRAGDVIRQVVVFD